MSADAWDLWVALVATATRGASPLDALREVIDHVPDCTRSDGLGYCCDGERAYWRAVREADVRRSEMASSRVVGG